MRLYSQLVTAATAAALATSAIGQTPMVLQEGTPIVIANRYELSIDDVKPGDQFEFILAEHLTVDGVVVVPAGAVGVGQIVGKRRNGGFRRDGRIDARPLFVDYGGQRILLASPAPKEPTAEERRALREERRRDQVYAETNAPGVGAHAALAVGVGVIAAAIIVMALTKGRKGTLEAGTPMTGFVRHSLTVAPAGSPPPYAVTAATPPMSVTPAPKPAPRAPEAPVVLTAI